MKYDNVVWTFALFFGFEIGIYLINVWHWEPRAIEIVLHLLHGVILSLTILERRRFLFSQKSPIPEQLVHQATYGFGP